MAERCPACESFESNRCPDPRCGHAPPDHHFLWPYVKPTCKTCKRKCEIPRECDFTEKGKGE